MIQILVNDKQLVTTHCVKPTVGEIIMIATLRGLYLGELYIVAMLAPHHRSRRRFGNVCRGTLSYYAF